METTTLQISGMTCGGCVNSVARVLKAVPGVSDAQVRLDPGEARVTFDPARIDVISLRKAVEDAGYEAR